MRTNTTKPQLTVSMLNTKCEVAWLRRYGARFGLHDREEIIPPGVAIGIGISVDKSVNANMENKITTGKVLPLEQVQDVARDEARRIADGEMRLVEDDAIDPKKTIDNMVDLAIALSRLHYNVFAPIITPIAIQNRFVINLEGYDFNLSGVQDIIAQDGVDAAGKPIINIRDTKTTGAAVSAEAARSLQMAMYCLGYKICGHDGNGPGTFPARVFLDYLTHRKTKSGFSISEQAREAVPDKSWIDPLFRRIEAFAEMIRAARAGFRPFRPAEADSWICTRRWCGFSDTCPYWSGR
jgi:hypothetical protein